MTTSTSTTTSSHIIEPEGVEAEKVALKIAVDGFYFFPDRVPNRLKAKLAQSIKLEGLNKITVVPGARYSTTPCNRSYNNCFY
jgi:hypothetical protein